MAKTFTKTAPYALVLGDFNVGKSTLINALLRQELVYTNRRQSNALPAFLAQAQNGESSFAAWPAEGQQASLEYEAFIGLRREPGKFCPYEAVGALVSGMPFARLITIDTPGTSTDHCETIDVTALAAVAPTMLVVVADIEYWNARHTMELLARHQDAYAGAILVVANKADHLNPDEIRRIADKASQRMANFGIASPPPFLTVSARLEAARRKGGDEYRQRTKRPVRELCDAAFDALRVALYEFEAMHALAAAPVKLEDLLSGAARKFIEALAPKGNGHALS